MYELIQRLVKAFPILGSPRFWGIVATAFFVYFKAKGWIDQDLATMIYTITGGATGVGILDKAAEKVMLGSTKIDDTKAQL